MNFTHTGNRIYMNDEQGQLLAEVTFPAVDADTVEIDHTYVSDVLRGQGVAGKIMLAAATQLREEHKKAVLTCSYAKKWFQDHPDYLDMVR